MSDADQERDYQREKDWSNRQIDGLSDIVDCNGGNHSWSFKPLDNDKSIANAYDFEWDMGNFSAIEICVECGKQRTSKYAYVGSEMV